MGNSGYGVRAKITAAAGVCFLVGALAIILVLFFYLRPSLGAPAATGGWSAEHVRLLAIVCAAFVVVGLAVILAVSMAAGRAARPLNMMMGILKQVGETGNLRLTDGEWANIRAAMALKDEIGQSVSALAKMLEQLARYDQALQAVAGRNLGVDVGTLGQSDTIGIALRSMVDNFNDIFKDISLSAGQVSDGSQQIADGSQSLAQGAAEQAESIERLSGAIADMTGSIEAAAGSAGNLAELAGSIKAKAEQGSSQMSSMMNAVREISEASRSINSVIRIIDDIAFQTNILALNAAVEAARAGQYGKGFAVVAEEVRNLAAKSAEAAKNTEALIEDSVRKAELGVEIANMTSESLEEIVNGVVTSGRLIDEIASGAGRQSEAIAQINISVEQISQIIHQNTATAEESAAASEELSGQSAMLGSLIARFSLRESFGGPAPASLPSGQRRPLSSVPRLPREAAAPPAPQLPAAGHSPGRNYEWSPELETGNQLIDSQHKQLVQTIAELMEACASGKGRGALGETIDFLEGYTAKHFSDEEGLQRQSRYPDYANHKKLHDAFKAVVADLGRQLKAEGPTVALVGKANSNIGGWLVNHIKREDKKVAAHIRAGQRDGA
ncbi:MAG: bacteriohemerythrin [Clostridiales Family XIII bacterium]|jgi:methyl-accepting chemotaxis protein|nr:bacteriohemerythrin [Clostridiales Family XIII bacterium]